MTQEIHNEIQRLQDQVAALLVPSNDNTPAVEQLQKQVAALAAKVAAMPKPLDEDVVVYRVERAMANTVSNQVAEAAGSLASEMAAEMQTIEANANAKAMTSIARMEADVMATKAVASQQVQIALETLVQAGYKYAHA